MIQLPADVDRGKALLKMAPNAVRDIVLSRKTQYFGSQRYSNLRNNCQIMDNYIDDRSTGYSSNVSNISPKTIRRGYHDFCALFHKFFENDPFFSVRRSNEMTPDDEKIITDILSENCEKTNYRDSCFSWTVDHIVRYGTSATYSFGVNDFNSNMLLTVKDAEAFDDSTYSQVYSTGTPAVISVPVHPLNVIVDPNSNFMTPSDYKGLLADIYISNLAQLVDNEYYESGAVKKAVEQIRDGYPDEYWYNGEYNERRDYSKGHGSICYLWTRLPIEGNEDDPTIYAIEEVAGEIIRIDENMLDSNTIPISVSRVLPRQYDWFGNSPLIDKISLQNLQTWLVNTFTEGTAKSMDRIMFYRAGDIPVEAMNARHQNNGLVPYRGSEPDLSKLMYPVQLNNIPFTNFDWLMQYTRREDQETSTIPNFNPQSEGGPTNKTLGGAQMIASIGEMRMSKHVIDLAKGQREVGNHHVAILKNIIPDELPEKQSIVKQHWLEIKTSNVFNYQRDSIDTQNRLTQAINYMSTGLPAFQQINLTQFIKDWLRATTKNDDIDAYFTENEQMSPIGQAGFPSPASDPPNMRGGMNVGI